MKIVHTLAFLLVSILAVAQQEVEITLKASADNDHCISIYVTANDTKDVLLKGQNYRLFYNDANLQFQKALIASELKSNNFKAEVAMHRDGLSKKIDGDIPFEKNMGFISLNVMPEDEIKDYVYLTASETLKITDVCFDNRVSTQDVMLSKRAVTSAYTAAYSVVDWEDVETADKKVSYTADLNLVTGGPKE